MRIRLAENFRAVFYAPFFASIALGFHAREGLEIELSTSATPGAGTIGLIDGSLDVTWGGPMRVMKSRDEADGPPLVAFCEVVRKDPFYLVGKSPGGAFDLRSLQGLRFASVSEVPTPWLCLQHDLRELGIDPASLDRIGDRSMAENLDALRNGEIDVAEMFEPYASIAVREGFDILHAASGRGETSYTTFLTLKPLIARNKDAFAAMQRAMLAMRGWLDAHSGRELADVVASTYYPSLDHADLAAALTRYKAADIWMTDTRVSRRGFDRLAQSLKSGGFISSIPDYDDCVADAQIAG